MAPGTASGRIPAAAGCPCPCPPARHSPRRRARSRRRRRASTTPPAVPAVWQGERGPIEPGRILLGTLGGARSNGIHARLVLLRPVETVAPVQFDGTGRVEQAESSKPGWAKPLRDGLGPRRQGKAPVAVQRLDPGARLLRSGALDVRIGVKVARAGSRPSWIVSGCSQLRVAPVDEEVTLRFPPHFPGRRPCTIRKSPHDRALEDGQRQACDAGLEGEQAPRQRLGGQCGGVQVFPRGVQ